MMEIHPLKKWIDGNTTQAQFARDCGMSEGYLSDIISGRKEPTLKVADKMSARTGREVPISAFVLAPVETVEE